MIECDPTESTNTPRLERAYFPYQIDLISTSQELELATRQLLAEPVLGFDTETRPSFTKGHSDRFVATVQFATASHAWIIRTHLLKLPPHLRSVIESPNVLKVGIAINEDIRRLRRYHPLTAQNILDLQLLAKMAGYKELSLKKLVTQFLHLEVSKAARLSNWEAESLTPKQLNYAATDAWLCYQLYYRSGLVTNPIGR